MKINVAVFPCGSQMGVDINFALRNCVRVRLFGASSRDDHGRFVYRNYYYGLPSISEPNFIEEFNKYLESNCIDAVIPTHDSVALFLKEQESLLKAKVIASELNTARICRYKSLLYEKFITYWFTPKIYRNIHDVEKYPVFLKPDDGQGSQHTYVVRNPSELRFYTAHVQNLVISEYLPGDEVTVDCFTDRHGCLRLVSPRARMRMNAGISVRTKTIHVSKEIAEIAETLNRELTLRGSWYFQIKGDQSGEYKLLEISTRLAGGAPLTYGRDVNLPLLSILDAMEMDFVIEPNDYNIEMDRSFLSRYFLDIQFSRVYVDLDDTLIVSGEVNSILLMFLYQCLNKKKDIILITKHESDVDETLKIFKIGKDIFSDIIHLAPAEKKSMYMKSDVPAIFIDNSFAERSDVRNTLGIPCFDVNNVEVLLDWRG